MRPILFALLFAAAPVGAVDRAALAREIAAAHQLDPAVVLPVLEKAEYKQSIIDAITRPAEAKPWKAYRPIFLSEQRIRDGRAFLAEHRDALAKVETELLNDHLGHCIEAAISGGDAADQRQKAGELIQLLQRSAR